MHLLIRIFKEFIVTNKQICQYYFHFQQLFVCFHSPNVCVSSLIQSLPFYKVSVNKTNSSIWKGMDSGYKHTLQGSTHKQWSCLNTRENHKHIRFATF